ncbi:unnamed protein product [Peronospora destructor]|uniref:Endonuclease/exonuclease/phosphatase domain-containing protein n=1 Tax=Peronospora destructor TaxID=86335 RepID=A0AAV0THD3_9STRA|nr:unnamed protein product [Peronospora destructor]
MWRAASITTQHTPFHLQVPSRLVFPAQGLRERSQLAADRPTRGRSKEVLTVLRSDFPGFDSAIELPSLAVPGRYLVVKLMVDSALIYIHNVYAPVDRQEKHQFFSSLATEEFEVHATLFVLGDLNTPPDPTLDSSTPNLHYDPVRASCLEWFAKLGVVDAWRIHFDTKHVFTGPLPRKNRLDYILLSGTNCDGYYASSKYFLPTHAGDHLAHSVHSRSGAQLHGRGEAELVRDALRTSSNPGKVWKGWKANIKTQLQGVQKKLRQQDPRAVEDARVVLDRAAKRYRTSARDDDCELFAEAMNTR